MKYLKKFNEGIDEWYFYLEQGEKYTLYNFFDDGPLPIEILEIDDNAYNELLDSNFLIE